MVIEPQDVEFTAIYRTSSHMSLQIFGGVLLTLEFVTITGFAKTLRLNLQLRSKRSGCRDRSFETARPNEIFSLSRRIFVYTFS